MLLYWISPRCRSLLSRHWVKFLFGLAILEYLWQVLYHILHILLGHLGVEMKGDLFLEELLCVGVILDIDALSLIGSHHRQRLVVYVGSHTTFCHLLDDIIIDIISHYSKIGWRIWLIKINCKLTKMIVEKDSNTCNKDNGNYKFVEFLHQLYYIDHFIYAQTNCPVLLYIICVCYRIFCW